MTMESELVERMDAYVKRLGTTRSPFARDALREALKRAEEKELEERHVSGYQRLPPRPSEFDLPESERAWGGEAWHDA